jgi:hypothetical protein
VSETLVSQALYHIRAAAQAASVDILCIVNGLTGGRPTSAQVAIVAALGYA